jgi:hypothetical protein
MGRPAWLTLLLCGTVCDVARSAQDVPVDWTDYSATCGVEIRPRDSRLEIVWPAERGEFGHVSLDLRPGRPLTASLGLAGDRTTPAAVVLNDVTPTTFVSVGTRQAPAGRPPHMSVFNVFFDKPASRPYRTHASALELKRVRVASRGHRATISVGELTIGPLRGDWQFTFYTGAPLVHVEAVVSTSEERRAIIYDAGLTGEDANWRQVAWLDTDGELQRTPIGPTTADRSLAVKYRTIAAESSRGAVACFPPPHQFFFPRDWTNNFQFAWLGRGHLAVAGEFGFGVRSDPAGGGAFVPWFNAPPGTEQRLGVFYWLTGGTAKQAISDALRFTRGDRFPALPGHLTLTSHWHMAMAVAAMEQKKQGHSPVVPDLVRVFKDMGVNAVHLAEFHGDGHQKDPGPLRLPELETMFDECRRLSDDQLLLIPGEEINDFLGIREPGKHPGHWMSLFPRPVYWVMQRGSDQPFAEPHERFGTLYRVGGRGDMVELLMREHGLAWAAHPRIKASSWTPDIFRHEDFYSADFWLGGAWKAMPADLSRPRLGERALDLLDDMANWSPRKYMPGEVDVFKIDRTHELYGHMNVNYVRLHRLPRFDDGWRSVLDALRAGQFFVTTGEVLLRDFTVGGQQSGAHLKLGNDLRPELRAELEWTFPLQFAEVISGDGQRVFRERIDLSDTEPFGRRTVTCRPDLTGRRWVRFEVWDVAVNGAFTQPVWLETP